jgi:hypothetical protein
MRFKKIIPVFIGGIIGYVYYYFIGCNSGTCPITSNSYISTIYGAVVGLIFLIPSKTKKKDDIKVN